MRFDCPRTCPAAGERWCRFRPLLDAIGPVRVDSHTVRVTVEYRDPDTLRAAVLAMGGAWIGLGKHRMFDGADVVGHGFTLPNWRRVLALSADGQLHYDDYGGVWGNVADLERLKIEYADAVVQRQAELLGWQTERQADTLTIYHPSGGTLTYRQGEIETAGFTGGACHEAREQLGLEKLGLRTTEISNKPECSAVAAAIQLPAQ